MSAPDLPPRDADATGLIVAGACPGPPWRTHVQAWRRRVRRVWDLGLDHLLPRQCALCDDWLGGLERGLCTGCAAALPGRSSRRCRRCALRLDDPIDEWDGLAPGLAGTHSDPGTESGWTCGACAGSSSPLQRVFSLCDYAPPIDRAVVAGKFHGQTSLLHRLGEALGEGLASGSFGAMAGAVPPQNAARRPLPTACVIDALVPVPLSDERLTDRGYNQAEILARALARRLAIPCRPRLLQRTRHTAAQSALNRMDREANLRDAFACRSEVDGRSIALVDDVMTTGATLHAAAVCLHRAGARAVFAVVIARTPAPRVPARSA